MKTRKMNVKRTEIVLFQLESEAYICQIRAKLP